jgi:acetyl esterase
VADRVRSRLGTTTQHFHWRRSPMLDPDIARMMQAMHDNGEPPLFESHDADAIRKRGEIVRVRYYPPVVMDVATVENLTIPGEGGDIPVRIYRPLEPTGATVVYFHGGGWIIGNLDSHDGHVRRITATVGAVVVHVDYRLAPEHPFPAGLNDCIAATEWAYRNVSSLGGRTDLIAVAGDSAGGNLAASVALHCRDTHLPLAAQLLIYPATDLTRLSPTNSSGDDDSFFTGQDDWVERTYLGGDLRQATDPRASPLHAEDHRDLPPTVIGVGRHDPLLEQNLAYAGALQACGVPTVLREYSGLVHGFFGMGTISASAEQAADQLTQDLRAVLLGVHV